MDSECEFFAVQQPNGSFIYDVDGDILLQRVEDGTQFYVAPGLIQIAEANSSEREETASQETANEEQINTNINEQRNEQQAEAAQWSRADTLKLIELYKENKALFASSTLKNVKVWQRIAEVLGTHSAKQCENKFKYLKEMDEVFRREPILSPVAIASSSRTNPLEDIPNGSPSPAGAEGENASTPQQHNTEHRSRRTIKLKEALVELNNILKDAEAQKQRRHQEMLELQRENMSKFLELMKDILNKF